MNNEELIWRVLEECSAAHTACVDAKQAAFAAEEARCLAEQAIDNAEDMAEQHYRLLDEAELASGKAVRLATVLCDKLEEK